MQQNNLPLTFTDRSTRTYLHKKCGTETEVSEIPLIDIAGPFEFVLGTKCAKCGFVKFSDVFWADTGESIADYRSRLRKVFTPLLMSPLMGGAIGSAVGCGLGILVLIMTWEDIKNVAGAALFVVGVAALGFVGSALGIIKNRGTMYYKYCNKHDIKPINID